MTLKTILHGAEKFVVDNSPGILTGLGVAGTVTTAILAGKGAYSSALLISERNHENDVHDLYMPPKEKLQLVWKEFVPAGIVGVATITAIIAANQIGSRRAAAFAAAFKLSESISDDYKKKVLETLGVKQEEKMRSDLAAEKMAANPPNGLIVVVGSEVLFFDEWSGRYFTSKMETVQAAVNEVNHKVNNYFFASLTDFYDLVGLTATGQSDDIGWNTHELLDIQYSPTMHDGKPAIMIGYNHEPIKGYDRLQ